MAHQTYSFKSPGPITREVIDDFHGLILTITEQGEFQSVIEHFKDRFSYGKSNAWSSSSSWSVTDMLAYMRLSSSMARAPATTETFIWATISRPTPGSRAPRPQRPR